MMAYVLEPCHPCERSKWSSRPLAYTWLFNPLERDDIPLCIILPFKIYPGEKKCYHPITAKELAIVTHNHMEESPRQVEQKMNERGPTV